MTVTLIETEYLFRQFHKNDSAMNHAAQFQKEELPFEYKEIFNFIKIEVNVLKSEPNSLDTERLLNRVNPINLQIIALIGITVIYMLIMNMIVYLDK
jgi:hypothetical protein